MVFEDDESSLDLDSESVDSESDQESYKEDCNCRSMFSELEDQRYGYRPNDKPDLLAGIFLTVGLVKEMRSTSSQCFESFKNLAMELRLRQKTFEQVEEIMRVDVLSNHPELLEKFNDDVSLVLPGNGVYCYTTPGTKVRFVPTFKISDLALPWDDPEATFSTECALCLGPFDENIRTLKCFHTFCNQCIVRQADRYARADQPDPNGILFPCPTCRGEATMEKIIPCNEKKYNSILIKLQEKTIKYKCAFEESGCKETFMKKDILNHIENCCFRKYQCDKGCKEILFHHERHSSSLDCIAFIRNQKEDIIREQRLTIHNLQVSIHKLQNGGRDNESVDGKRKRCTVGNSCHIV